MKTKTLLGISLIICAILGLLLSVFMNNYRNLLGENRKLTGYNNNLNEMMAHLFYDYCGNKGGVTIIKFNPNELKETVPEEFLNTKVISCSEGYYSGIIFFDEENKEIKFYLGEIGE